MAKEKIPDIKKQSIAKLGLKGKQFNYLASTLDVSVTTARKADKIGGLLNVIDEVKESNRYKDVIISLYEHKLALLTNRSLKKKHK